MYGGSVNRIIMIIAISCLFGPVLYPGLNQQVSSKTINPKNIGKDDILDLSINNEKLAEINIFIGNQFIKRYVTRENALKLKKSLEKDDKINILHYLKKLDLTEENVKLVDRLYTKKNATMKKNPHGKNNSTDQYLNNSFCRINGNLTGNLRITFDDCLWFAAFYFSLIENWGQFFSPLIQNLGRKIKNLFLIPLYIHTHRPYRFPMQLHIHGWVSGTIKTKGITREWEHNICSANLEIFGFIGVWFQINMPFLNPPERYFIDEWNHFFNGYCIKCSAGNYQLF